MGGYLRHGLIERISKDCIGLFNRFWNLFSIHLLHVMLVDILLLGKNSNHGGSIWLRQKVWIIPLMVELVDHHALFEITNRHISVGILIDVRFCECLLIANLWLRFFNDL